MIRILEGMLPLPLCSGRHDPGTLLDMKSVWTLWRRGRYLLMPGIEPRLTVLPVCCVVTVLTKQGGLKKPRMFFEEDSRSLSQESPVLDIPNIVPRNCVLIIQIDSQTGPHKYSYFVWRNIDSCSGPPVARTAITCKYFAVCVFVCFVCVRMCLCVLCCNTNYMKQRHLAAIQVRVRWHLAFNGLNIISVCLRLPILCCYFAECNNNSHHLFVWCHGQGSERQTVSRP
jgi:hypothetical protein